METRWRIAICLVVASSCATLAVWRMGLLRRPERNPEVAAYFREARAVYAPVKMVALDPTLSREEVCARLDAMEFAGDPPPADGALDALRAEAADFIYFRFAQASPEAYRRWRDGGGARRRPVERLSAQAEAGAAYEALFGEPVPRDVTFDAFLDRMWPTGLAIGDGANRPTAMAIEATGLAAAIGTMATDDIRDRPRIDATLSNQWWRGINGGTMRGWWDPPLTFTELLRRDGRVVCAEVGVLLEFASGARRPLVLTYFWDPRARRWYLQIVCQYNVRDSEQLSALEF